MSLYMYYVYFMLHKVLQYFTVNMCYSCTN